MNRTIKRGIGNRTLWWNQGPSIRQSMNQYNLTNEEEALYEQVNNHVAQQGLDPTEIMREINASNVNKKTKKKLAKHWMRQYKGMISQNRINNTVKQVLANRATKTRRNRRR